MSASNRSRGAVPGQPEKSAGEVSMLALVTDAFGGYGGIAQYNRDFLTAAAASGLLSDVLVLPRITPLPTGPLPPGVVQASPVRNRFLYALRALVVAVRSRPEVIFNAHLLHGPLALLLARLTGASLVSQIHGTEVWNSIPARCQPALECSALILAVSRDTRARVLTALRIAPEKVAVLGNTVGEEFTPGNRTEARQRFGLSDELAILTVARLDERNGYKGHDRIIGLLPALRRRGLDVTYLIAGVGPDRDRLQRLAVDLSVNANVRFLGMVATEDLPDLYRAADLFALPSTGEGFGIVYLEAMACGTPAIGLAVGGVPDALGGGELGVCAQAHEFADTLLAMLADGPRRDQDLPKRVRERFGYEGFAHALATHLKSHLSSSLTSSYTSPN